MSEGPEPVVGAMVDQVANFTPRPRVEIAKTAKGVRTWRISVQAVEGSEAALRAAADLAMELDAQFSDRWPA